MRGVAAALVIGALLSGFGALLHARLTAQQASGAYHWRVIPSPNTVLAVNTLTGVTMRSSADGWAWGATNVAPDNANSNPTSMPLVEHWDGHRWRIVATPTIPFGAQIADIVSLAPDNAWAVGSQFITPTSSQNTTVGTLIEHWDGRVWTITPDQLANAGLNALAALSADDIWAVGGGPQAGLIQHWDGRNWRTIADPSPAGAQLNAITAVAPNDAWVVGMDGHRNGIFEHWDGRQWRLVASPASSHVGPISSHETLNAISAVSANDIWASGFVIPAIPFPNSAEPLFEHWDGHTWNIVSGPSVDATTSDIVALGPNDVWAVGTAATGCLCIDVAQQGQGLVEHWDGHTWTQITNPTPRPFTSLSGVARDPSAPGKVWVVGITGPAFTSHDQLTDTATLIETNR